MDERPVRDSWLGRRGVSAGAIGFALFSLLSGAVVMSRDGHVFAGLVEQPIAFNHKKHVKEQDLACSACHASFEKETFAGIPTAEACSMCHAEAQGKSEEEARLVRLLQEGAPLEWKPLFQQPPHVFYSHRRHVVAAKIECPVCHGSIGESERPPGEVKRLRMDDCVDCHRKAGVSTDCTACHR